MKTLSITPKFQKMSEKTLKWYFVSLHLKLNSDLHKTDLYEELNLFFFKL